MAKTGRRTEAHAARPASLPLERFLGVLKPLLAEHSAHSAWLVGSQARGEAAPESDIDVIIVAPADRQRPESRQGII
jgi:predicted nucleotidyltransferase